MLGKVPRILLLSTLAVALVAPQLRAQSSPPPQTYSLTQTGSMFMQGATTTIYRDGSKAVVEMSAPPQAPGRQATHTRTFFDLQAHRNFTVDLNDSSRPCGVATFTGDWGDPFALSAQMTGELMKQRPKEMGAETVNGIATKVFEIANPDGPERAKVWLDTRYNLMIKWEMVTADGQRRAMLEVKQFSTAKPPASELALPAACVATAAGPAPQPGSQHIAEVTGGNADDFAKAAPPPSPNSCTVLFRIVRAGSLQPVTSGFRVGIDTDVDLEHLANYAIGSGTGPGPMFSGGHIREVTGQMRNGILRIDNVPPQFDLELSFGNNGGASALTYRQCYQRETTLLLVLKNPERVGEGADWLWVKTAKLPAALSAPLTAAPGAPLRRPAP